MRITGNNERLTAYSDKGFTLVEVIIAVVIMAIAAIPLLHAFSTSANTSSKALIKMRATNAAENIMEDIKGMTVEEVVDKYGPVSDPVVTTPNYAGENTITPGDEGGYVPLKDAAGNAIANSGYKFELKSSDSSLNEDINNVLDKGYTATIELDPTYYPNINGVNMSDFDEVSSAHSAILSVDSSLNKQAVDKFVDINSSYTGHEINNPSKTPDKVIGGEYKREIRIVVTKKGTEKEVDGEKITPVEVSATVSYLLYDSDYVPKANASQRLLNRKLFNNTTNDNKLNSIFIMYEPLYENAKENRDIIVINNEDNIEFNLYVIAQNAVGDEWKDYRKKSSGGLILEIYEDEIDDVVNGGKKQPITLYTNLHEDIDYNRAVDSELKPVQCFITLEKHSPINSDDVFDGIVYKRITNKKGSWGEDTAGVSNAKALDARDIDGKNLDASKVEDKIYDVRVTVSKATGDDEWPVSVSLTGTMVK